MKKHYLLIGMVLCVFLLAGCNVYDGYDYDNNSSSAQLTAVDKSGSAAIDGIDGFDFDTDVVSVNITLGKDLANARYHLHGNINSAYAATMKFDAQRRGSQLAVKFRRTTERINFWHEPMGKLQLDVELPEKNYRELTAKMETGALQIDGMHCADVTVKTETGSISLRRLDSKTTKLNTETGSVTVDGYRGQLTCTTETGSVRVSAVDVADDMVLRTETGSIKLHRVFAGNIKLNTETGSVNVEDYRGALSCETETGTILVSVEEIQNNVDLRSDIGSITLTVSKIPDNPRLTLSSDIGSIINNWGAAIKAKGHYQSGSGKLSISIRTDTGSIRLERGK